MASALWLGIFAVLAFVAATADSLVRARETGAPIRKAVWEPGRMIAGLLVQQNRNTVAADTLLRRAGVLSLVVAAGLAGLAVTADYSVGVVWFNAMEVVAWAAVWLVGWGSNSVAGLVGGYRFVAQGLAYELPHMFALITAALGAESLRVQDIARAQEALWFVVWMPAAFIVYLISVLAMAFWGPFDHPVGRDIAGGAKAELSGVDRLLFEAGRWLLLVVGAAVAVPLFLGGGGWLALIIKTAAVLAVLLWAKRRFPAIRMERYEEIAWMVLIPVTLVQALLVALVVLGRG